MQFDNQYRQIKLKIVYYGPALGGKTTCLQHIHRVVDPERRTRLYSLNTANDRTLFFDLLALELGRIRGYKLALQLYTVPGQVQYNATRRAVLSGADGVVFVADSQLGQRDANLESLANLWENLEANGIDRGEVPLVLQYNKRDLPGLLSLSELDADLNPHRLPAFPSVATDGSGVMEGFAEITERTLRGVADKLGVLTSPEAVERLLAQPREALRPLLDTTPRATADDVEVVRPAGDAPVGAPGQPLREDTLVQEAVRANVAMTDLNARLDLVYRQLERRVAVMGGLAAFGSAVVLEHDPGGVLDVLLRTVVELLRVPAASVLALAADGTMRRAGARGLEEDPLLAARDGEGKPLAAALVARRRPVLVVRDLGSTGEDPHLLPAVEAAGFASAVAVPMVAQDEVIGLLCAYGPGDRLALDEDDLQLAGVAAATAAMAYANATAWQRLEELNRGLEDQVRERTSELAASLEEVRRLAGDLEGRNTLLDDAYRELSQLDGLRQHLLERLSGDLRGHVSSLATAAKVLAGSLDAPAERLGRFVTVIRDEAEALTRAIDSVVQGEVLGRFGRQVDAEVVAVEELLKRVVAPLREAAASVRVAVKVLTPSGLSAVWCEPETAAVALRALVKNAIDFNRPGGEVKIELHRVTQQGRAWLVVKVRDTGVGITEDDLPRVFEPFWQGAAVAPGGRGVGLGLAIVKRVAEAHGGTVTIASTPGEGTDVTLALPQDGLTERSAAEAVPSA